MPGKKPIAAVEFSGIRDVVETSHAVEHYLDGLDENLKINILSQSDEQVVFELVGVDASIANALRRVLIAEVPTMAISTVFMNNNTSVMQDEVLCHRLGLIPIKADANDFDYICPPGENGHNRSDFTDKNSLKFNLRVTCPSLSELQKAANNRNVEYLTVYSQSLELEKLGRQLDLPEGQIGLVHDDIILTKLAPGQAIDLECYATKGVGEDHAKWSPVCTAVYRMRPSIRFPKPLVGEDAERMKQTCPMGVFDIEDIGGEKTLHVAHDLNCTMCRECIRLPENREKVQLGVIRNDFIFSVESTGCVSAKSLVPRALEVLKQKCETIIKELEELENGVPMEEEDEEEKKIMVEEEEEEEEGMKMEKE
ncbi:uncharacterized protein [Blastocystis hominis]|uniref:DNA-directed RNA polymerase RpoA/D/Rpb3-type domain-containing protein n=1 Tax=Blastocystis hominis TaxID=12968 RepID=D8LZ62_BLAHO|nr:uncharacterized protein [Blastocystis hominis]CBK21101.2 unnamed protein product [Blastocystis hominis]|eukprot:XP_012895149.1 uncharacterized protein [Blastocystis hominis]